MNGKNFAALAMAVLAAAPAAAITYIGGSTIGAATVSLSISTDGTLGTLTAANITDWTITSVVPPRAGFEGFGIDTFVFTPATSNLNLAGSSLSATATTLDFNFGSELPSYLQVVESPVAEPGIVHFWCVESAGGCSGNNGGREVVYSRTALTERVEVERTGLITLATAPAVGGVPEPASWAMLIAGFGLTGAVARRRHRSVAA